MRERTLIRTVFEPELMSLEEYRSAHGESLSGGGWSRMWRKKIDATASTTGKLMQRAEVVDYTEGDDQKQTSFFGHKGILARYVPGTSGELIAGDDERSVIWLNQAHWLVERWMEETPPPKMVAWLLLACYGHVNAANETSVTSSHEQVFHLRVLNALADGTLKDEQPEFA